MKGWKAKGVTALDDLAGNEWKWADIYTAGLMRENGKQMCRYTHRGSGDGKGGKEGYCRAERERLDVKRQEGLDWSFILACGKVLRSGCNIKLEGNAHKVSIKECQHPKYVPTKG